MLLSELIQEDLVKMNLEATNKWDAIEELVDLLVSAHELRLSNRAEVMDSVYERERSLSTGLEHGLAVPHGAVECVGEILAAVGLSSAGIPFDSLDGKPSRLIVLLIIPKGAAQRHVRTLAGIARLASNQGLRSHILEAETPAEIIEAIYLLEQQDANTDPDSA